MNRNFYLIFSIFDLISIPFQKKREKKNNNFS